MLGHSDYKLLILRNNGSIEGFDFESPVQLKSAFDAMRLTLVNGEVIRSLAFGKVIETFDCEIKKSYRDYPGLWLAMRSPEEIAQDERDENEED